MISLGLKSRVVGEESYRQCPAVTTQRSLINDPPQRRIQPERVRMIIVVVVVIAVVVVVFVKFVVME